MVSFSKVIEVAGSDIGIDVFDVEVIGGNAVFTIQLSNDGDLDTGPFEAHLFYHRDEAPEMGVSGALTHTVANLSADGGISQFSLQWTTVPQGEHKSWLVVDAMNVVVETKEGNNVAGPAEISVDEAVCPMDTYLSSVCTCGGVSIQTGYCCNGAYSALPCNILTAEPDAGSTDAGNAEDDIDEDEDIVEEDIGLQTEDSGGCNSSGSSPMIPPIVILALTSLIILARSRRHP